MKKKNKTIKMNVLVTEGKSENKIVNVLMKEGTTKIQKIRIFGKATKQKNKII